MIYFLFFFCCLCSCAPQRLHVDTQIKTDVPKEINASLASINIIDRNGFTETISSEDRLKKYEKMFFLQQQPYQKVFRVFQRDKQGHVHSIITSYHTNGEPKQYLEIVDGRAHGLYTEWYPNGKKKLTAYVSEGTADIDEISQLTWSFDGVSRAWNEDGCLSAEISYVKGELSGTSHYYFPSGALSKAVPYVKGVISGTSKEWYSDGSLLLQEEYVEGQKHGKAIGYWPGHILAVEETYEKNLLLEGKYFTKDKTLLTSVANGKGTKCYFDKEGPRQYHEYVNGNPEGKVTVIEKGAVACVYFIKDGQKHGTEVFYYQPENKAKLSIEWNKGIISGTVKTWYDNGVQESQREMSQNKKQGLFTAWYRDGSLMFMEEYDKDKLVKGNYSRKGDKLTCSKVSNGIGTATFFDPEGNFLKKVQYHDGKPVDPT